MTQNNTTDNNNDERNKFNAYLATCSNSEVRDAFNRESRARRFLLEELAFAELVKRGLAEY